MRKNRVLIFAIFFSIISLFFTISSFVFVLLQTKEKAISTSSIYNKGINYIVEVKAFSDDVGESFGTGVVISNDGKIITNAHVVTYTKLNKESIFNEYYVRFAYEEDYRSVILERYDSDLDLAILKFVDIYSVSLSPVCFGKASKLNFGDRVFAMGNASNFGIGIFEGIISVPKVNVELEGSIRNVIQCDLTIASGNSGGALLNEKNELIGITTFRLKDNSGKIIYGIVYCIPIDVVEQFIND